MLAALTSNFPHVTALLKALPLSAVTAETPHLLAFLGTALHLSPAQVAAALKANFPAIFQAVTNLPFVTNGWNNIPGTAGLTNFSGAPVHSVPQMQAYLSTNVVPFLSTENADFQPVSNTWPRLPVFPPLLLVTGIIVVLFGATMLLLTLRRSAPVSASAPAPPAREPVGAGR